MQAFDFNTIKQKINTKGFFGCDSALGNLFLLKDRYKIHFEARDSFLLREFNYSDSIKGYLFPIPYKNSNNVLNDFLNLITENRKKTEISLCLFTNEQKDEFNRFLEQDCPSYSIEWQTNPADSDYLYLQKDLADLNGQKLQKKRNHISRFQRTFPHYSFLYFNKTNFSQNIYDDFMKVADKWIEEQSENHDNSGISIYEAERNSVRQALDNLSIFDYSGGILYVEEKPVAITLASKISEEVLDIHFEKCLKEFADFGGYAVINNQFAKMNDSYKYINREEDLGIEGLRKAKLSYKPIMILEKNYGKLIKN